jgi:hypothetical protein
MANYVGNKFGKQDVDKLVSTSRRGGELPSPTRAPSNDRGGHLLPPFPVAEGIREAGGPQRQECPGSAGGDEAARQEGASPPAAVAAAPPFPSLPPPTPLSHSPHSAQLEDMRKNEDPRLSFSTPEFKEAQRAFTDGFKKNFGKPVEWALVKDHPWSTPQLRKLDAPVG